MNDPDSFLLQKDAVLEVANRLFINTGNSDWPKVKACFTDEVLFDMTSMTGGEPARMTSETIASAWEKGLKVSRAINHQTGNHIAKVSGNEAEAFGDGIVSHYLIGNFDLHDFISGMKFTKPQ